MKRSKRVFDKSKRRRIQLGPPTHIQAASNPIERRHPQKTSVCTKRDPMAQFMAIQHLHDCSEYTAEQLSRGNRR